MGQRMSPKAQTDARKLLEQQKAQTMTGDAEMDSLLSKELSRKMTFAAPEVGKADSSAKPSLFNKLVAAFRGKKPRK